MSEKYEIPGSVKELFTDDCADYRIVDYNLGEMDNVQSMSYFMECVGISNDYVLLNDGTQVHFWHPEFIYHIVIDSSGLGDFWSHGFEVTKVTFSEYLKELDTVSKPKTARVLEISEKKQAEVTPEEVKELFEFIYLNN